MEEDSLFKHRLDNNSINILNIKYRFKKPFDKLSIKSTSYITNCFKTALRISKKIKMHSKVTIEEFEIIKESVTFKLPNLLN